MSREFAGDDLSNAVFWGADLRGAHFRSVDLTGASTHHATVEQVEIDGFIDGLVVNGVDVTEFVNAGDPWFPLRRQLRPASADEVRAGWTALRAAWSETMAYAATLPEADLRRSVDGEWSFVETLRHLIFGVDKWIIGPLLDGEWQSIGISNSGSVDYPWPGVVRTADPDYDEVLRTRAEQLRTIDQLVERLVDAELAGEVTVLENGVVPRMQCWLTLFEEEFEHRRYALRDLATLSPSPD